MLFEQLDRLPDHVAAATGASRRAACFDAHHAVVPFKHIVFGAEFFAVEIDSFENIDHCWHHFLGQRESRIMLGIAPDLQHAVTELRERCRQVGRRRRLPDPAFAVDRKHLCALDLVLRVERNLHAALAITCPERRRRGRGGIQKIERHIFAPVILREPGLPAGPPDRCWRLSGQRVFLRRGSTTSARMLRASGRQRGPMIWG